MSTTIDALEQRVQSLERELQRLARLVEDPEQTGPPMDGTLDQWLERLRKKKLAGPTLAQTRRALGIPEDLEPIGAKAVREMMLAEGVRPEERLGSSEILRMREE